MFKKCILYILFLVVPGISLAADANVVEVLPNLDNNQANTVVLNDQLRRTSRRLLSLENNIGDINDKTTGILEVSRGGTGQDMSAVAQNAIPYFSAAGVVGNIGIGTSGYVLTSQGASTAPSYTRISGSNVLFQYSGQVDQQGAALGETTSATYTPVGKTGLYRYLIGAGGGQTIWTAKFIKSSLISTVTVWCRIWTESTGTARLVVDVGGQSGNVSGTSAQATPEWKSFTVDVSSLTNGTSYDVTATLNDVSGNNKNVACSNIMGFGS